ncbi:MAG: hypothetical protein E7488_02065 [Ruminococcaceae bacterium]|nr:hypothetical protein [Oscillospiraceae bacterium]
MYPIHKEKYYLTGETFHSFMRDRLEKDLKKEKNGYKLMAIAMFVVCAVVIGLMMFSANTTLKDDFVWMVLPVVFIFLGISNLNKMRSAERGLDKKIIRDYTEQKFEKYQMDVKFYEDKVTYKHGEKEEELEYNTFKKFYESEKYFAAFFTTGDIIIFNPNCKSDKIKEIINNYVKSVREN